MKSAKADLFKRFIAALIDGIISSILLYIPVLGWLAAPVYTLTKDSIAYEITKNESFRNRSLGKRLMGLKVVSFEGNDIDWTISLKRNLPLVIGGIIALIPLIGWVLGGIIGLVAFIIEGVLVITDQEGRRMGDRWADTQVITTEIYELPS